NDSALIDYDTNLKVNPPLRTGEDQLALQLALAEGLVDCIASHHMPEHWDDKTCEFEYAKDGMITLESLFGAMNTGKNLDMLITALTENPRTIFQLPSQQIAVGKNACLTFFNPDTKYVFEEKHIHSLSRNSAFIGKPLKGLVYGIFNNNKLVVNENT
ncbi:MAG: dihydroorotase, partial [Ferruginibacter sp.]